MFELTGRVHRHGTVTAATLGALPAVDVVVQHQRRGQALPARTHRGAPLFDLLVDAGLDGDRGPYPYVNLYLVASGEDGAEVVFSLPELDPAFGGSRVLLVAGAEGEPACRLVAADDRAGARSIRRLRRIDVRHAGGPAPRPPRPH